VIHLRRADTGQLCTGPDRARVNCFRCYVARSGLAPQTKQKFSKRSDAELRAHVALSKAPLLRDSRPFQNVRRVTERPTFLTNAINMTDRVIAPTKLTRDLLIRNGIDPHRIMLASYGMDTSAISAVPWSTTRPSKLRFGYIGALAPHKGADILIKAFKNIPEAANTELKIYGSPKRDPRFYNQLVKLAEGDERIDFAGTFEAEEMGDVLSEIDVLVIPSRWYENTPLVVYSAFASGTPVVATDLGGLSEVIDHGRNGLLFRMGDFRELNRLLLRFFFEEDLVERLRAGIEPVRTVSDSVDELEVLYEELLRSPRLLASRG
ncbi:MAG TPA: glycosyltransferase, partial [Rubrobacter sp.]|nr:glycosyltransferase [Rubrobacter sp.]